MWQAEGARSLKSIDSCIKKLPNSRKGLQPWDSFAELVPYQAQV
jgi:hypothetical protein